jgi:hypothetical protein
MPKKIKYKYKPSVSAILLGSFFSCTSIIAAVAILTGEEFESFVGYVLILLALIGGILIFIRRGIIFNVENKTIKQYYTIYGIPFGEWISIEKYPYISILNKQYSGAFKSGGNLQMHQSKFNHFELTLLDKSHRMKLLINSYDEYNMAENVMKKLSSKLNIEIVKYSPKIGAKSKQRR